MAKPYSEDLRERLIAAVESEALSCREVGRRYRVSASSAVRWVQQYRKMGRTKARAMGGDRRSVLKPERTWLLALIAKEKDLTLMALSARLLAERGVKADASMLCRFFKSEAISFKKNRARRRAAQA
jgi:putative transposase